MRYLVDVVEERLLTIVVEVDDDKTENETKDLIQELYKNESFNLNDPKTSIEHEIFVNDVDENTTCIDFDLRTPREHKNSV